MKLPLYRILYCTFKSIHYIESLQVKECKNVENLLDYKNNILYIRLHVLVRVNRRCVGASESLIRFRRTIIKIWKKAVPIRQKIWSFFVNFNWFTQTFDERGDQSSNLEHSLYIQYYILQQSCYFLFTVLLLFTVQ